MNQILLIEKKKKNKRNAAPLDLNKVILSFSISLIVFGGALFGQGTYAVIRNADYTNKIENAEPSAVFEQNGQYLYIRVTHILPLDKIEYNWNNSENSTIECNGKNIVTGKIELPRGNNTLNIIIKDKTGKESSLKKDYSIETGRDIQKPTVDISVSGNYIKLEAKDDVELSYITYRWNNDTEEIIHPSGTDKAKIEASVEIRKGQNDFTVIAVDTSNNTTTRKETFAGLTKPTVEVVIDGDSFLITAKHEKGIDRIEYTLNGQKYSIQYTPGPEMQYRQKMVAGYNELSVQAYSTDGTLGTFDGHATYTPPAE